MNPRSLVGMTQGARKRAWGESRTLYALIFPNGIKTDEQEMIAGYSWSEIRAYWNELGQRLRPCPGCHGCMPGVNGWHIDKVRGRYRMPTTAWCCEGSGVLPAKKAKVRNGLG